MVVLKKFMGIDPSYSGFGVTILSDDGSYRTEVWQFPPSKSGGSGVNQLYTIRSALRSFLESRDALIGLSHIVLEGYAHAAKYGLTKSGELGGVVKLALLDWVPPPMCWPTIVAPTQLKEYVTGEGSADKKQMISGVESIWGATFPWIAKNKRDNAADSYAAARLARDLYWGTAQYQYQRDVLKRLKKKMYTEGGQWLADWQDLGQKAA